MMSNDPPPRHPLILRFVHAGLRGAQIKHIDQFQLSYYQFDNTGLWRAQDPMGCQLIGYTQTLCLMELRNFTPVDWCNVA